MSRVLSNRALAATKYYHLIDFPRHFRVPPWRLCANPHSCRPRFRHDIQRLTALNEKEVWRTLLSAVDSLDAVRHIGLTMKTATVRDLRNRFPRVAAWIEEGQPVEITKAGKPFARLVPAAPKKPRRFKMPDILARLERAYGDRVYSAEAVARMRAAELEGEEG